MNNPEIFSEWLNDVLQKELSKIINANYFNLYENVNKKMNQKTIKDITLADIQKAKAIRDNKKNG